MPNCARCGKDLFEDMRFCPYCGQLVQSDDIEQFEPTRGEVVTAVISPTHIVGRDGIFAVAMTTRQLLFARIEEGTVDKAKSELRQKGIFLAGSSSSSNISRFYEMVPDQLLKERPDNFTLGIDEIESVRLSYDSDENGLYVVDLKNGEKELRFTMPYDRYYRDLLFRTFEGRMSW